MAKVTFYRLGGDVEEREVGEDMTVKDAIKSGLLPYQEGDQVRIQNKDVDMDTKIDAKTKQFVTAVPRVNGG